MMSHQRGGKSANSKINDYLTKEYWPQSDFEKFLYMGQVMQGDAIKIAVEAHRRDMPFCQGSLFWQHNDCWPVASWSSRDYYGRWKAQHYFARQFFDKYLITAYPRDGRLKLFVVSDSQVAQSGELKLQILTLDGKVVKEISKRVKVPANTSTIFVDESIEAILGTAKAEDVVIASTLTVGEKSYSNTNFFVRQRYLNLPKADIKVNVADVADGVEITLSTDNFARAVYLAVEDIESRFEDNFIDILPQSSRKIKVQTGLSAKEFSKQLKILHLQQTK
jgi:beta-mannosidase